mgnify:CR=1 FL=1
MSGEVIAAYVVAGITLLWNIWQQRQINRIRRDDRVLKMRLSATLDSQKNNCIHFVNEGALTMYGPKLNAEQFSRAGVQSYYFELAMKPVPPNTACEFLLNDGGDVFKLPDLLEVTWYEDKEQKTPHTLACSIADVKKELSGRLVSHF